MCLADYGGTELCRGRERYSGKRELGTECNRKKILKKICKQVQTKRRDREREREKLLEGEE